jgi:hypothetical protein
MRRTAVAVIGFGCAVGVFTAAGMSPVSARAADRSEASASVSGAGASASKLTTIDYDGYSITVPSSWPVFHLATDPGQCLRYDINAVYLGNPGANQNCPSTLIGRAQTITITGAGVSGTPQAGYQRAAVAQGGLGAAPPASSPGSRIASVPATLSRLDQYSQLHEFQGAVSHSHLSVTGTYGASSAPIENIIRGLRKLGGSQPTGTTAGGSQARTSAATVAMTDRTLPFMATVAPKPKPKPKPAPKTATAPRAATAPKVITRPMAKPRPSTSLARILAPSLRPDIPSSPLNGFDTCTAPSVQAMRAWKAKYSAIGIYIGGQNMACDYGNLSASWVKSVHAQGWSLLPLYVGLQAPCNGFPAPINEANAAAQGRAAANTAVADAVNFGLGKGTPIYFDMESYNNSNANCRNTVLTFLNTWTRELHDRGYTSGVYSSAASGVTDLVTNRVIGGHPLAEPDAIWFALWDNDNNLTGTPYLPATRWASDRVKQYAGNETQKVGGYTINIDADRIHGAVSGP